MLRLPPERRPGLQLKVTGKMAVDASNEVHPGLDRPW